MNKLLFQIAIDLVCKDSVNNGIGTLKEKSLHRVIKHYIENDEEKHEQRILGYVADIFTDNHVYEIQTANFNKLRAKLDCFLDRYDVTVCYPIPRVKYLSWINIETGEASEKRKSPKKGTSYLIFNELYKIKNYLNHPHLHLKILLIDEIEYRLLDGWNETKKKGSHRENRVPLELIDEIDIISASDYSKLMPLLNEQFTSKDFALSAHINLKMAQIALNIFKYLGLITVVGKDKNSIIYKKNI